MSLDELTPWLFARTSGGIRWGLERTEELLAGVGDPHRLFHSVLIGGTNGKGSVAALCDAALRAEGGKRIGLYTSPHLISFAERIRVDGAPLDDGAVAAAAERLRPAIERTGATFFEATTAIAFLAFAEAGVEMAVVEVGLGGRLDSTNVLTPLVTAITNIGIDHAEYLGDTIEQIAGEKAGILKVGVPAITGERSPEGLRVIRERAESVGAPLVELDAVAAVDDVRIGAAGTELLLRSRRWGEVRLRSTLPGEHQARNAALAAEVLGLLPAEQAPSVESIRRGFAATRWPGRLQVETTRGTTWLFDVAHNPDGARALAAALPALDLPRPHVLVAGILSDKNWREMLSALTPQVDAAILVVPPSAPVGRRWAPSDAAEWIGKSSSLPVRVMEEFEAALMRAETMAPHGTVIVTGSVHTVGDAMASLGIAAV